MTPSRPAYWEIEPTWLFYLFAGIAVIIFAIGLARRIAGWRRGAGSFAIPPVGRSLVALLRDGLLGARLFRADVTGAVMHLAIMWGFLGLFAGTLIVALDHYLIGFLTGGVYVVFSVAMELCGLILLAGISWALARRYLQRLPRLTRGLSDLAAPSWLLVIGASGFALEGARLAAQQPAWAGYSFAGLALTGIWPTGEAAIVPYRVLWWGHALASLGFVAYLPWSKMLHTLLAPMALSVPAALVDESIAAEGPTRLTWRHLLFGDACVACGRCVEVCPSAAAAEPLSPRECVQAVRRANAKDGTLAAQAWYCTTCGACSWACPISIQPVEIIARARRALIEEGGEVPVQLAETLERLYKYQNPWLPKKGQKSAWQGTDAIRDLNETREEAELLYFVGCTTALDTRAQGIARAISAVLANCAVPFGTLGKKEPCCGDIARRTGEAGLFEEQHDELQKRLAKVGVTDLVTSSPHCWDTLAHAHQGGTRASHYSQLLARLITEGRLTFIEGRSRRVTFHDPCYLARHNGVIAAPRLVLGATGAELVEMEQHGAASLCCGGGGGRMWQELPGQGELAQRRIRQAVATGAEVLVTACPLCLIMLEDARKTSGFEDRLTIVDLAELVASTMETKEV